MQLVVRSFSIVIMFREEHVVQDIAALLLQLARIAEAIPEP